MCFAHFCQNYERKKKNALSPLRVPDWYNVIWTAYSVDHCSMKAWLMMEHRETEKGRPGRREREGDTESERGSYGDAISTSESCLYYWIYSVLRTKKFFFFLLKISRFELNFWSLCSWNDPIGYLKITLLIPYSYVAFHGWQRTYIFFFSHLLFTVNL